MVYEVIQEESDDSFFFFTLRLPQCFLCHKHLQLPAKRTRQRKRGVREYMFSAYPLLLFCVLAREGTSSDDRDAARDNLII